MNTMKKSGAEKAVVAGKVDTSKLSVEEKRLLKLEQLKAKTKKQAQLIKAAQKAEMKKSCMPVGKAILEKSAALKLDIVVYDAVNYLGAGWILVKLLVNLKGEEQENFLKMVKKYSGADTETMTFLYKLAGFSEKQKVQPVQKKVEDFKIEPDNEQEIPY